MKKFFVLSAILSIFIYALIGSCKKKEDQKVQNTVDSDSIELQTKIEQAKEIFYSLPAPNEVAELLTNKENDAYFNLDLLNKVQNSDKYVTQTARAYNLGVYSADLSYASLYEQNQTVINYMAICKTIAEDLGIIEAFDDSTINSLQENITNRDEVMRIISENFMNSDAYLQENHQQDIGAMILLGGWIQGMYIAVKLSDCNVKKNPKLISSILEQKLSLELTMKFLEDYKDFDGLNKFYKEINELYEIYQNTPIDVDDQGLFTVKQKDFEKICNKIVEIRNKIVSLT